MRRLGDLEAVVMERMWSVDSSATVRDVWEHLRAGRKIAYTTVMTAMDNLHRKGFLLRERDGRAYRYRTAASREAYRAELMQEALGVGAPEAVLTHFVGQLSGDERARLDEILRRVREAG